MLQLSKNLTLVSIEENNVRNDELIAVKLFFNFFGEDGEVYLTMDKVDNTHPSYAMTEITSELADSFNDLIEEWENWLKIIEKVKEFHAEWKTENQE